MDTSPTMNSTPISFGQVFASLIRHPSLLKARRTAWPSEHYMTLQPGTLGERAHLRMTFPDGTSEPYSPTHSDHFQEDWTIENR